MKKTTKREQSLIDELEEVSIERERLESKLDQSIQLSKDLEEAYRKLMTKYDLVLASHHVTTQIFSHQ
jgi:hypothetical protein